MRADFVDADVMYGISNGVEEREEDDEALFVPLNERERERESRDLCVQCNYVSVFSPKLLLFFFRTFLSIITN